MGTKNLFWLLTVLFHLFNHAVCQVAPDPKPAPADALHGTSNVLRSSGYAASFWSPANVLQQNVYVARFRDGGLEVDRIEGNPNNRRGLARTYNDAWRVDHVFELNQIQRFIKETVAQMNRNNNDLPRARSWVDILESNRDELGAGSAVARLQYDFVKTLNGYRRDGNLAGIISQERESTTGRDINQVKYNALAGHTFGVTRTEGILRSTMKYMTRVTPQYRSTVRDLAAKFRTPDDRRVWRRFGRWANDNWDSAIQRLEGRLHNLMNEQGPRPNRIKSRQTSNPYRAWSSAFMNQGNGIYVALGDSFSAGLGAGTLDSATARPDNTKYACRRYSESFPNLLSRELRPVRFDNLACSGATTEEVRNEQIPEIDPWASLITVTIGGNDVKFADLAIACVYFPFSRYAQECRENGIVWCCDRVIANSNRTISLLGTSLVPLYRDIRESAPYANILVLGYPAFYNVDEVNCPTPLDVRQRLNNLVDRLNAVTRRAAESAGLTFLDPNPAFNGHRFCEHQPQTTAEWLRSSQPEPWFYSDESNRGDKKRRNLPQHPHARSTFEEAEVVDLDETDLRDFNMTMLDTGLEKRLSFEYTQYFHPNRRGQRAYFDAALPVINRFPENLLPDTDTDPDGDDRPDTESDS